MGNRKADLRAFLETAGQVERLADLVADFQSLQSALFARAEAEKAGRPLSAATLEAIVMSANEPQWLDDQGRAALVEWLVWMCWHEGLLADD